VKIDNDPEKALKLQELQKKYKPLLEKETYKDTPVTLWDVIHVINTKETIINGKKMESIGEIIIDSPVALEYVTAVGKIYGSFNTFGETSSENKEYRTKARVIKTLEFIAKNNPSSDDMLSTLPSRLAIITAPLYQYGVSFYQHNNAWLQLLSNAEGLEYDKEKGLRFKGIPMSNAELKNLFTKKGVEDINLPLLKFFYSIILKNFYDKLQINDDGTHKTAKPILQESITLYLPDLAAQLGKSRKLNKENIKEVIAHVSAFQNIVGILKVRRNGRIYENILPVLLFMGYYDETNTIKFSSPYLNQLIIEIFGTSIAKDKKGNTVFDKKGEIKLLPSHSYLIKPSIEKCRNKAAVESVTVIVQLIEQTGNPQKGQETITAHITAKNILERNVQLYERYNAINDNAHKNRLLKTHFAKVYELLKKETTLFETYHNLTLTEVIPTASTLDMVLKFTHKGKIKN